MSVPGFPHGANTAQLSHRYLWGPQVDQMLADEAVTDPLVVGIVFAHINTKYNPDLDLNGDGVANQADVDLLVEGIIETAYGDADLNGVVDGADFLTWNANRFTSGTG